MPSSSSSIGVVIALIAVFVFFPVSTILASAFADNSGNFAPARVRRPSSSTSSVWGLDCLSSDLRCGVAWNTLFLGLLVGVGTTAARARLRADRDAHELPLQEAPARDERAADHHAALRDRPRADPAVRPLRRRVRRCCGDWFGMPRSRWIYGLPGVLIAQLLAFTPIAFLVLIGVVQGISPTLEEASQTLRAKSWTTF